MTASFKTNPISLKDLMRDCHEGKLRLPDFQRGWVWDQDRIIELVASVSEAFPVGALMTLDAAGDVKFATDSIEGAPPSVKPLEAYLLDGQQRLTSLYQATYSEHPVRTKTQRKKPAEVYFYFDIRRALDRSALRRDAIIVMPKDKVERPDFGKKIVRDLSSEDKEYEELCFPINRMFEAQKWIQGALTWVLQDVGARADHMRLINDFSQKVVNSFTDYHLPVITLGKETTRAAVCLVFEKINTGGKPLDAFELVTAMYASEDFKLRKDWAARRERLVKRKVLANIEPVEFLQVVSLLHARTTRRASPPGLSTPNTTKKASWSATPIFSARTTPTRA